MVATEQFSRVIDWTGASGQESALSVRLEEKQNRQSEADSDYRASVALYGKAIGANHPEALHARELYSRFAKKMHRAGP